MSILIDLALAVIAFIISQWLLGLAGLPSTICILLAIVVAVIVFFNHPSARIR